MSLFDNVKLSVAGIVDVLLKWQYALIAIVTSLIFGMIFGVLSIGTSEWNLLVSALPLVDKIDILLRAVVRVFTHLTSITDLFIAAVVILQGITVALLVFNIRQQRQSGKEQSAMMDRAGESTTASLVATLGLGCSACGTSLIVPVISLVSSSALFLGVVTTAIIVIALLLLLYSSWKMGQTAYMFTSVARLNRKGV